MKRLCPVLTICIVAILFLQPGCKSISPFKKSGIKVPTAAPAEEKPKGTSLKKQVKRIARKGRKGIDSLLGRGQKPSSPLAPIENIFAEVRSGYDYGPAPEYSQRELERAGTYADLLFGRQPYANRQAILKRLARQPDPKAQAALIMVLSTRADPLSALAINPLLGLDTESGLRAIRTATHDARTNVSAQALLTYIQSGRADAVGICRDLFSSQSHNKIRAIAALGLGEAEAAGSQEELRQAVQTDFPMVRFCAAWALWRMGDDGGRAFIDRIAASNDQTLSPMAISFLYAMGDPASIPSLLAALNSNHNAIWLPAFNTLLTMPAEIVLEVITFRRPYTQLSSGREIRRSILLKLPLLLEQQEKKTSATGKDSPQVEIQFDEGQLLELHQAMLEISLQDNPEEMRLMALILKKWNNPAAIEPLIRSLASQDGKLRAVCSEALRALADKISPKTYPQGDMQIPWRRWWLRNCRPLTVRDTASGQIVCVIQSPGGNSYFAAPDLEIAPGVVVHKVETGTPPIISVFYDNQIYDILGEETSEIPD